MPIFPDFFYHEVAQTPPKKTKSAKDIDLSITQIIDPNDKGNLDFGDSVVVKKNNILDKVCYFLGFAFIAALFGFFIGVENQEFNIVYLFALSIILSIFKELGFEIPFLSNKDKIVENLKANSTSATIDPINKKAIIGRFMGISFMLLSIAIFIGYKSGVNYKSYKNADPFYNPELISNLAKSTKALLSSDDSLVKWVKYSDSIQGYGYTNSEVQKLFKNMVNSSKADSVILNSQKMDSLFIIYKDSSVASLLKIMCKKK